MFDRAGLKQKLEYLAAHHVYLGTSSWKYHGWCGQLYEYDRYVRRGTFSQARFERACLSEYAEVFKTVCVDAAYYTFPRREQLESLAAEVPPDFKFTFKVTDEITLKKFTRLPRFGERAGKSNENFLNVDLFAQEFLQPCAAIRAQVGLLIFEFSRFHASEFARGHDFVEALDVFLSKLPKDWRYGVEIRNPTFLHPTYFATLARHQVAHIFNSWQDMPSVREQMQLASSRTTPGLVGARFLLAPGRKYQDAVDLFQPYREVKEVNQEARLAGGALLQEGMEKWPSGETYIYVNNRLEGNALQTISAMLEYFAAARGSPGPQQAD